MLLENYFFLFSHFWHSLVWGSKSFNWIYGEINFLAKDLSFKLHCAPSLLQSVTMFYPSTSPVSPFSPLCPYPNFDVPHLSPGQHHAPSASLPVTTHFNPSFLLLSELFSKTQIDHVILPSTPPPSSHWLLMGNTTSNHPQHGVQAWAGWTFLDSCSLLHTPQAAPALVRQFLLPHPSHTSLPLFLSFSLDCPALLLQPIKVLPSTPGRLSSKVTDLQLFHLTLVRISLPSRLCKGDTCSSVFFSFHSVLNHSWLFTCQSPSLTTSSQEQELVSIPICLSAITGAQ